MLARGRVQRAPAIGKMYGHMHRALGLQMAGARLKLPGDGGELDAHCSYNSGRGFGERRRRRLSPREARRRRGAARLRAEGLSLRGSHAQGTLEDGDELGARCSYEAKPA